MSLLAYHITSKTITGLLEEYICIYCLHATQQKKKKKRRKKKRKMLINRIYRLFLFSLVEQQYLNINTNTTQNHTMIKQNLD